MYQAITLTAGTDVEFVEKADFFRLLESVPSDVRLTFYAAGREVAKVKNAAAGYAEKFDTPFDKVVLNSTAGGAIQFVLRLGSDVRYDKAPTGSVTVVANSGNPAQLQKTVTNASTVLLASNANRKYLFVQNNDPAGIVYLGLDWTAATVAKGVRLLPGESFEMSGNAYVIVGTVTAIGSIASNTNVVTVEG